MRILLLAAAVLTLAACTDNRNAARRAGAAPAPAPRAFAIDYVASPNAHFEAVADHNREVEAEAKAAEEAAKPRAAGRTAGSSARSGSSSPAAR